MRYLVSLKSVKSSDTAYIFVFEKIPDGTVIGWGTDCQENDGTRKWKVMSCSEDMYSSWGTADGRADNR